MLSKKLLINRLINTKQMFSHGEQHANIAGEFNRLISIISIDQAVESFLCIVISNFGGKIPKNNSFENLYTEANTLLNKKNGDNDLLLSFKSEIQKMRFARNNAQHDGLIPSEEDLLNFIEIVRDFLIAFFKTCCDIDYNEVFISDFIKNKVVRDHFKEGEKFFYEEKYNEASVEIAKSYAFLSIDIFYWDDSIETELETACEQEEQRRAYEYGGDHPVSTDNKVKNIIELVKQVDEKVNILSCGVSLQDYKLFKEEAPSIGISVAGNIISVNGKARKMERGDCLKILNLVYNLILYTQQH